ncbi:lipid kinase YegS [Lysobacter sp. GCM10012299]|uniref:lipid kinase YegS n=1 Tax=Lysobacter sp. GCM10012299 TaxID=3317333 RepID=UPI00361D7511
MAQPRWRLILNGKSAGDDDLRDAVTAMRDRGIALDVRVTWEHGDASRYVEEAIETGVDCILAGGGDGTLGEVAGALAEHCTGAVRAPSLGLVPLGTANDFAGAAGIPTQPLEALLLVAQTQPRPFDMMQVDADGDLRWCANMASGGFGTDVTVETHDGLKQVLGSLAYLVTGIARLGQFDPVSARVRGPDFAWDGEFIALGVGNGRQAGGGHVLCPEARVDDGLLDLTVIPPLSGEVMATMTTMVSEGRDAALARHAVQARLDRLEIQGEQPLTLNLDGEPVQARRFDIRCVPGKLLMHLPVGAFEAE